MPSLDNTNSTSSLLDKLEHLLSPTMMVESAQGSSDQTKDDKETTVSGDQEATSRQIADLQSKLEELQHLIKDKSLEFNEVMEEISKITEERDKLRNDLVKSERDIQEKDKEISEMTGKIEEFSKELLEFRESQQVVAKEKNHLHEQLEMTEGKMTEMEENFLALMVELTSVKDENQHLMEEKNESAIEFEELQLEKLTLEETVASIQSCLESSEKTFSEMRFTLEDHEHARKKMGDELEEVTKLNEKLQQESKERDTKWHQQAMEFEKEREIIESDKTELEGELEQTKKKMEETNFRLGSLEGDLSQKLTEMQNVEELLLASRSKESDLVEQLNDVENKMQNIHQEKEELEIKAKDFNYEFMCGRSALETMESNVEESKQRIEEKESKIAELMTILEENEKDQNKIREELEEARNMVKELQLEVTPKVKETDEQPMIDVQREDESHRSNAVIVPNIQVENVNLRQQIELLLANKDEFCRKVVDEKAMMEEHINSLMEGLKGKSNQVEAMEVQYNAIEVELRNAQRDCEGKGQAIQTLMENMELSRLEMEALRSKIKEIDALRESVVEAEQKVLDVKEELTKKEKNWSKEKDGWEKEVSAVKFEMSAKEMEHQETTKVLESQLSDEKSLGSQVGHYEALVDTLELELRQLREEKEHEQDRGVELHRELQKVLQENKILARELVTTNGLLIDEKRSNSNMKKHLGENAEHLSGSEVSLCDRLSECEADNTELKKKVIQLVREKDSLWQKITKLEHDQYLRASDKWMEDADVTKCLGCSAEFSLVLRKHHCRLCGRIFCHDCCDHWVLTPHSSKKERVCTSCLMSHSLLETSDNGSETAENDFLESVQIPERRSKKWSESAEVVDDEDKSQDEPMEKTDLSEASAQCCHGDVESGLDLDEARLLSMTDDNKSGINRLRLGSFATDSIEQSSDSEGHGSLDITSSERADTDEAYDMITADEVLDSMSEPVPDPNLETHDTITVEKIESGSLLCPPELTISAGKKYAVPIFIETVGVTFSWEFTTKPKGITFSLTYKENEFVSPSYQEVLIDLCKCDSHKESVLGNLTARKPGIYTLLFDNSSSRFTSKKINFNLKIMDVENISCT